MLDAELFYSLDCSEASKFRRSLEGLLCRDEGNILLEGMLALTSYC
jgi:hypothetical protein